MVACLWSRSQPVALARPGRGRRSALVPLAVGVAAISLRIAAGGPATADPSIPPATAHGARSSSGSARRATASRPRPSPSTRRAARRRDAAAATRRSPRAIASRSADGSSRSRPTTAGTGRTCAGSASLPRSVPARSSGSGRTARRPVRRGRPAVLGRGPDPGAARARGRAGRRDPHRPARPGRSRPRRGVHDGRRQPRRRDLRLEHRDRRGPRRRAAPWPARPARAIARHARRDRRLHGCRRGIGRRSSGRRSWRRSCCSPASRAGPARRPPRSAGPCPASAGRSRRRSATPGFQLSVLATAGLIAWATPITERLRAWTRGRLPGWLAESLGVSFAAEAATLPVVLAGFGRFALLAPAVNLVVVPLVPPAMAAGTLALVGGWLTQAGAPPIVATSWDCPAGSSSRSSSAVVRTAAVGAVRERHPGRRRGVRCSGSSPAAACCLGASGGLDGGSRLARARDGSQDAAAATGRPRRSPAGRRRAVPLATASGPSRSCVAVCVAAVVIAAANRPDGRVRVTVLDVGQGDAILVEGGRGGRLLVDGGPDPDRLLVALDATAPAVGSPDRPARPEPPPRGSRRRARPPARPVPGRPDVRARNDRAGTRLSGLAGRPAPPRAPAGPPGDRRPARARRHPVPRPVAGSGRRPARAGRRRHGDQQRLDRPARRGRPPAVPAGRRHRGGDRPDPRRPRPAPGRLPQDRPPRQPDVVDRSVPRCGPAAGGGRLGRSGQPVRPSDEGDPRPGRRPRRRASCGPIGTAASRSRSTGRPSSTSGPNVATRQSLRVRRSPIGGPAPTSGPRRCRRPRSARRRPRRSDRRSCAPQAGVLVRDRDRGG